MKERPIIFSAPMVRAILEGRKTQTRRNLYVLRRATRFSCVDDRYAPPTVRIINGFPDTPVGQCWQMSDWRKTRVGDRLWVRETFGYLHEFYVDAPASGEVIYRADGEGPENRNGDQWRPSIHMPRWASRIALEVTGVRVERLQEISQADCIAEGIPESTNGFLHHVVADYRKLWSSINGPDSWDANPWVWVVAFRRLQS